MGLSEKEAFRLLTKFSNGLITYTHEEIERSAAEMVQVREDAQRESYGGAKFGEAPISRYGRRSI